MAKQQPKSVEEAAQELRELVREANQVLRDIRTERKLFQEELRIGREDLTGQLDEESKRLFTDQGSKYLVNAYNAIQAKVVRNFTDDANRMIAVTQQLMELVELEIRKSKRKIVPAPMLEPLIVTDPEVVDMMRILHSEFEIEE